MLEYFEVDFGRERDKGQSGRGRQEIVGARSIGLDLRVVSISQLGKNEGPTSLRGIIGALGSSCGGLVLS